MSVGDSVTIIDEGAGDYRVELTLYTRDPQMIFGSVQGLLAQQNVRSDILPETEYQQGKEEAPANVVPLRKSGNTVYRTDGHCYNDMGGSVPCTKDAIDAPKEDGEPEPASPETLQKEYRNLEKLNALLFEGRVRQRDGTYQTFGIENWKEGVASFCSHIHLKEAEHHLSEYVADRRSAEDTNDDDSDFE